MTILTTKGYKQSSKHKGYWKERQFEEMNTKVTSRFNEYITGPVKYTNTIVLEANCGTYYDESQVLQLESAWN